MSAECHRRLWVPDSPRRANAFDPVGQVTALAALAGFTCGVMEGGSGAYGDPDVIAAFVRKAPHAGLWSSPRTRSPSEISYGPGFSQVNLETDLPAIEATCDDFSGARCSNPPPGAAFYPFPHTMSPSGLRAETGRCVWTIGSDNPRQFSILGGTPTSAWGPLERTDFGRGSIASENYASGLLTDPRPGAVAS